MAIAVAVVAVAVEWSVGGALAGLAGAVVGVLVGLAAVELGTLVGGLAFGLRVKEVVIGFGPRLREWHTPKWSVSLRVLPLVLSVASGPEKAPVRLRGWLAALCAALAGVAAALVVVLLADDAFSRGLAVGCVANVLYALVPRRTPTVTSVGWRLFRRPTPAEVRRAAATGLVRRTLDAASAGDLTTARALADELAEQHPDLRTARAARAFVAVAGGDYVTATQLVLALTNDPEQQPAEAATSFASLAGMVAIAVEAGQLAADVGLPTAHKAAENAEALGYPRYRLHGTHALFALMAGDHDQAIKLARTASDLSTDPLARADDYATLARAHMAAGDNKAARAVLAEAEKFSAWWPRVAETRRRLDVS
jgi:hypothetical protein